MQQLVPTPVTWRSSWSSNAAEGVVRHTVCRRALQACSLSLTAPATAQGSLWHWASGSVLRGRSWVPEHHCILLVACCSAGQAFVVLKGVCCTEVHGLSGMGCMLTSMQRRDGNSPLPPSHIECLPGCCTIRTVQVMCCCCLGVLLCWQACCLLGCGCW